MPSPASPRKIAFLLFPSVQILDFTGPISVFHIANRVAEREVYQCALLASAPGGVESSMGVRIEANQAYSQVRHGIDTLIIPGGLGINAVLKQEPAVIAWLQQIAPHVRRLVSVCTGALLLAEAGLLDGKRATTHWSWCQRLSEQHPQVCVEPDAIFIRDGSTWTSAGITAGIDLALALVEEDLGRRIALACARHLVMFMRRPGGQSQFSAQLAAQSVEHQPLRKLQEWILANLTADLSVAALAERVAMSPRHFARVFTREVRSTPADFVESARLEAARRLLVEETNVSVDEVARLAGFGSAEQMRRAFHRKLGVNARDYRDRFRTQPAPQNKTTTEIRL